MWLHTYIFRLSTGGRAAKTPNKMKRHEIPFFPKARKGVRHSKSKKKQTKIFTDGTFEPALFDDDVDLIGCCSIIK